jgi:hypothetical protein
MIPLEWARCLHRVIRAQSRLLNRVAGPNLIAVWRRLSMLKRTFEIGLSILLVAPLALSQARDGGGKSGKAIGDLESRRMRAMREVDLAVLNHVLGDDLTYTHASGRVDTKPQFISALQSGQLKYESIDPEGVQVRVYGGTAVVTGQAAIKVKSRDQELSFRVRYIDVWVKRNATWQMVAWQSTRLAEQ